MENERQSQLAFAAVLLAAALVAVADPPATSPATLGQGTTVSVAPNDKEIVSARWWLDLAESELKNVHSPYENRAAVSSLIRARIASGDVDGANRLLLEVPKKSMELWTLQNAVARETIRQLVTAGQLEKATDAARKTGPPGPYNRDCWADLAAAEARAGDIPLAFRTLAKLDKDTAGKASIAAVNMTIGAGNLEMARETAGQITDEFSKQLSMEHIAIAEASKGDIEGAIKDVAGLNAPSVRSSACVNVAAAAAAKKDDVGAVRIIDSLPEQERPMATRFFAIAQLDRGDAVAAVKTSGQITGNDLDYFRLDFAEHCVRLGHTDDAIRILRDKWEPVALATTFNAMLKYQKLDAARSMLAMLPEQTSREGFDYVDYKIDGKRRLAEALANDDQLLEAEKLLADADADAAKHPPHQRDRSQEGTKLAIAAAELRAGHTDIYDRERRPYVDAVKAATDAASQQNARRAIVGFDFLTHNISEVEKELRSADANERHVSAYEIAFTLLDSTANGDRPRYLAEDRRLLAIVLRDPQVGHGALLDTIAGWHSDQSKLSDWYTWAHTLPTANWRVEAYIAAAHTLQPHLAYDY